MRFFSYSDRLTEGLAAFAPDGSCHGLPMSAAAFPGTLDALVAAGPDALAKAYATLLAAPVIDAGKVFRRPPFTRASKIICVGLNYRAHSAEGGFAQPDYPALFARFPSGFIAHEQAMIRPRASSELDYEGELVAVIGKGGRYIPLASALDHVAGYSIFNDGSIRDFQLNAPQWTVGKNFDGTGAFGPDFVTADELPPGCRGLTLETRLNGQTVQTTLIDDMVFDVASLVSIISKTMTLEAGDVIVTGTPAGVGLGYKPPRYMKAGDVVEVEISKIGILRNTIVDEA